MDRATAIFVDGIGTAAATSGILSQLQGRIFALLYLQPRALSLEEIAAELQQSKSNISVNIRGLVDWHLVRRTPVGGSREDHYEAATNFWRVMQEVMERRFRWTVRQVLAAIAESERAESESGGTKSGDGAGAGFARQRLGALKLFFAAVDGAIGAFTEGKPVAAESLKNVIPFAAGASRKIGA